MNPGQHKGTILIVDDEAMILKFLSTLLQREGYRTIPLSDSEKALEAVNESIDLIITDINMPELNGLELLKESKRRSPETEVIIITAYGTLDLDIEASHLKAFAFLQKPLPQPNELIRIVGEAIQESKTLKANKRSFKEQQANKNFSLGLAQTEALVNSITESALILNEEGKVLYSNLQTAQLIRLPYDQLCNSDFSMFFIRSKKVQKALQDCLESREIRSIKTRMIDIKGKTLPVKVKFNVLNPEDKTVLALVRDLAPLKEAQQKATQMARIVETLNYDMILICNTQGRILESNKTAQQDFRYISNELQNSSITRLFQFEDSMEGLNRLLDEEGLVNRDLNAIRSDGTEFPAKITLHKHDNEIVCIIKNQTDEEFYKQQLKESLRQQEEQNAQLKKLLKSKSEFVSSVSHELKTPLNSIIGFSEILEQSLDGLISENDEKLLHKINSNGQRLLKLIDSILALKSGHDKAHKANFLEVDILRMTYNLIEDFRLTCKEKGLSLEVTSDEDELYFKTDPDKVIQILVNLISNAIKFTKEGTVSVDIKQMETGMLVIKVIDEGEGIAEEHLKRIFEPFFQENQSHTRDHEGIGLGLAISQEQAELLGGKISVKSRKGHGSTFTLILPAKS